eukprot:9497699-Pyramimonas_sp.AAC.1
MGSLLSMFLDSDLAPLNLQTFTLQKTFKGHLMSVSNVAIHPKKPIIATASDDCTWKMWGLPGGDIIMSGDGHKDWVASVNFHPLGTHLVSASGDCTVKLWSFEKAKCVATFTEHTQVTHSRQNLVLADLISCTESPHEVSVRWKAYYGCKPALIILALLCVSGKTFWIHCIGPLDLKGCYRADKAAF